MNDDKRSGAGQGPGKDPDAGPEPRRDGEDTFDPGHTPIRDARGGADPAERGDLARGADPRRDSVPVDRAYEREHFEPEELSNPLPKWFSAMSVALVAWGAAYFYFQGVQPAGAGDHRSVLALAADGPVDGGTVYAGNCQACHQATGLGLAGAFPPLVESGWVLGEPEVIGQILLHGIQGPIEVLGEVYNGVMPAFPQLSDAELAAVTNYVRTEWGNEAPEVTADWYAEQRTLFPDDRGPWSGGQEIVDEVGPPLAVGS